MTGYAQSVIDGYIKEKGSAPRPRNAPTSADLRVADRDAMQDPAMVKEAKYAKSAVAQCLWLGRCTRIDILVAVVLLASRTSRWTQTAEDQLRCLIGYLIATINHKLHITCKAADRSTKSCKFILFTDADLCCPRSIGGWLLGVIGSRGSWMPVAWASRRQAIACDSTLASEWVSCAGGVKEAWLAARELGEFIFDDVSPVEVRVDNAALLRVAKKGESSALRLLSRAIQVRIGLLRDMQLRKLIRVIYVPSELNFSDILTKCFSGAMIRRLRELVGIYEEGPLEPHLAVQFTATRAQDSWVPGSSSMIRAHRRVRRRRFYPKTADVQLFHLGHRRITVAISVPTSWSQKPQETLYSDAWRNVGSPQHESVWTGCTIFC